MASPMPSPQISVTRAAAPHARRDSRSRRFPTTNSNTPTTTREQSHEATVRVSTIARPRRCRFPSAIEQYATTRMSSLQPQTTPPPLPAFVVLERHTCSPVYIYESFRCWLRLQPCLPTPTPTALHRQAGDGLGRTEVIRRAPPKPQR